MNMNWQDILAIVVPLCALLGWIYKRIDGKFDKIDKRFENVEKRFDKIDVRFERIEEKLQIMDSRISRIEGQLTIPHF